ncbi:MAG: lysine--tRNA ligase, partial [Planktomarina sp.]
ARMDEKTGQAENLPTHLMSLVYETGREHYGKEHMRDWFKALYEVLLGASQGPRFGGFIALYGVDETVALIDDALAGSFAN